VYTAPYRDIYLGELLLYPNAGAVVIRDGYDGHELCALDGEQTNDYCGFSIGAGNIDGVLGTDILMGCPGRYDDDRGAVETYHGTTCTPFLNSEIEGVYPEGRFGQAVSYATNICNNTMHAQILVGAPNALDQRGAIQGFIRYQEEFLWSEEACLFDIGYRRDDLLGFSISRAGMVDSQGQMLVGAPGANGNGEAYVYEGNFVERVFVLTPDIDE
jgi:hypothetical protein